MIDDEQLFQFQLLSTLNRIADALEQIGEGVQLAASQGTVTLQNNELISVTKPIKGDVA